MLVGERDFCADGVRVKGRLVKKSEVTSNILDTLFFTALSQKTLK